MESKKLTTNLLLIAFTIFGLVVSAQSPSQKEMLETFVKYASVNSQSSYDSTITTGQLNMARVLRDDVARCVAENNSKNVEIILSDEGYLYVKIPANVKKPCPSFGISCHHDVTPEAPGGNIRPITDTKDGHTIVRTDGTTLLGADDKCGCTIAIQLIRTILREKKLRHGEVMFAFCPNEDVGRAADAIDSSIFSPDMLFDLDGTGGNDIYKSNFTARGFNVKFIGHDAHPGDAKEQKLGDATAAAATFIAAVPIENRPENTDGLQGYIHPWSFEKDGCDVIVQARIRYFDKDEGAMFDRIVTEAIERIKRDFPNVRVEILYDDIQYENVAYTIHPQAQSLVEDAAKKIGLDVNFEDVRGGTTASMFAAKGLKGGMCVFTGQHDIHSTREYADLQEMENSYRLMLEIIKSVPDIK